MWRFARDFKDAIIDVDEIYSNDVWAGLQAYGVEMARATIVHEIARVFKAYNIDIDMRHLELIADYMVSSHLVKLR